MATDAISALGAGSGMDVKALTTSLVDAERLPRKEAIDKKITKSESAISGYGAIKFVLEGLNKAFSDLNDQSDYSSLSAQNSQPNSVAVSATSTASAGNHQVTVTSLAKADRWISAGYSSASTHLNGGATFDLSLSIHGVPQGNITIPTNQDTPSGIVAAINASNKGVTAQLVTTGDAATPYKVMITGKTGEAQDFVLSSPVLTTTKIQSAANASANIDGILVSSASNKLDNFFPGVTFEFLAPTASISTTSIDGAGNSSMVSTPVPANVNFSRDTASVKSKIEALVKAYNDANAMLNTVSDPKSSVETYGGSLVGDSIVNTVRNQMRELVFTDSNSLMSANTEGLSAFSVQNSGVAGSALKKLNNLLSSTGILSSQTTSINNKITNYKSELTKLEDRMTQLKERYTKQFAAMDSIVGQSKSLRTSLTSTFEGMMATYTKN